MENILIHQIDINDPLYQQVYELREAILRKPIGLSLKNEDLSGDALDIILAAVNNNTIIGCVMLHPTQNSNTIKLRQMAVAENWQQKGIGKFLVESAEKLMAEKNISKIELHARITAVGFYEHQGYKTEGEIFMEVGIPHVRMQKNII